MVPFLPIFLNYQLEAMGPAHRTFWCGLTARVAPLIIILASPAGAGWPTGARADLDGVHAQRLLNSAFSRHCSPSLCS
jgi:hypothetical protein